LERWAALRRWFFGIYGDINRVFLDFLVSLESPLNGGHFGGNFVCFRAVFTIILSVWPGCEKRDHWNAGRLCVGGFFFIL
jgi:hypothetical protein